MNLPRMAIRRGVTFGMVFLMVLGFGLFSLSRLRLDLYPDITFPVVIVITQYAGAGPFDMETTVSRPIEQAVSSVENVKHVYSQSRTGVSLVILEFDWGSDMEQAQTDVIRALEWVDDIMPDDAASPLVFAFDPSQMPIIFFGVGSPILDQAQLRRLCVDDIVPRLERIGGVAAADVLGGLERQIRVDIDPRVISSYGLSVGSIVNALRGANLQIPGGTIRDGRTAFSVRTLGEYRSLEEIRGTVVANRGGQAIRLDDVARVEDSFRETAGETRVNQVPGLMLLVRKQSDANTVQVVDRVFDEIPRIVESVPGEVILTPIFDQSQFIKRSLGNLGTTAIVAFFMTIIVLLVFLRNLRSALVVAVAIPMSVIFTFFVMDQAGVTLNIISMAGLALAIGMLVDSSIVVLENIYRHRELGSNRREGAERGTREVGMAITASTLTTLAIFLPMLFVPGIAGVMFRDMVLAICFALFASLMIALTLIPLLASRILARTEIAGNGIRRWIYDAIGNALAALEYRYTIVLSWALSHRKTVVFSALAAFIASFFLIARVGVDFIPQIDEGMIQFEVEHKVGTDLPTTLQTMLAIEDFIAQNVPEAVNIYTTAGAGEGIGAVFSESGTHSGTIQIRLAPLAQRRRSQFEIQDSIREFLGTIPGITYSFEEGGGMGMTSDIQIKLFSNDINRMGTIADEIVREVATVPGAVDVQSSLKQGAPELRIAFDRDRLQAVGLSAGQVSSEISNAILGITATQYREGGEEYDVFVRLEERFRQSPEQLDNLMISTHAGQPIPLRQIADLTREVGPVSISREDQSRVVSVSANISGADLGSVVAGINERLSRIDIPSDIIVEIGGAAEDQQESFFYLILAIAAGIVLVYMVMASQFESLADPFIVMVAIPLSFIGVALGLFITQTTLSLMAMIGILVLVGIVVNNGIVLVDYANQLHRDRGMGVYEAAEEAGRVRMRPVLMTALTTIVGMLPLALGLGASGEIWAPLARAVIGGLAASSILTLVVVPVSFTLAESAARWVRQRVLKKIVADDTVVDPSEGKRVERTMVS